MTVQIVTFKLQSALRFFRSIGYTYESRVNDKEKYSVSLINGDSSKIELIVPKESKSKEQKFLNANGAHVYKLLFSEDNLESVKGMFDKFDLAYEEKDSNNNKIILCYKAEYSYIYKKSIKRDDKSYSLWNVNVVNEENLKHKAQFIPIRNYTGKRLSMLPVYEVCRETLSYREQYEHPHNDLQKELVKIWSDVLHVENIGINEGFFKLGGNSLKLVTMVSRINERLGTKMTINEIMNKVSIKEISKYITNKYKGNTSDDVVLFNEGNSKNIFSFPPILGYGIVYKELAEILNKYSFYAFNYKEDEDKITKYADIITNIQPKGEYTLFGYSAGGILAYEVANELEKRGYCVKNIILLDSMAQLAKSSEEDYENNGYEMKLRNEIELNKIYKMFIDEIMNKTEKYKQYIDDFICVDKIKANIHLISSEDESNSKYDVWCKLTESNCIKYIGSGTHDKMIAEKYLIENSKIIETILDI